MKKKQKLFANHKKKLLDFAEKISVGIMANLIVRFIMWLIGLIL